MAVTINFLTQGLTDAAQSVFTTASVAPASNRLLLLTVVGRRISGGIPAAPTISGNGLTWVEIDSNAFDTIGTPLQRVTVYRAMGASPSSGVVTITWPSDVDKSQWTLTEYIGIDTSGTNGSGAIVQSVSDIGGPISTSFSITLSAFSSAENATVGSFGNNTSSPRAAGSGFAIVDNNTESVFQEWRNDNDTTVDYTFDNANTHHAGTALEIKVAVEAGSSSGAHGKMGFMF